MCVCVETLDGTGGFVSDSIGISVGAGSSDGFKINIGALPVGFGCNVLLVGVTGAFASAALSLLNKTTAVVHIAIITVRVTESSIVITTCFFFIPFLSKTLIKNKSPTTVRYNQRTFLGANGGNRTHGLFITSELLYP